MPENNRIKGTTGDQSVDDALDGDLEAAISDERAFADSLIAEGKVSRRTMGTGDSDAIVKALEELRGRVKSSNSGHMYEVDINADPADFLDWDAPFSEQPAKVQSHFAHLNKGGRAPYGDELARRIESRIWRDEAKDLARLAKAHATMSCSTTR